MISGFPGPALGLSLRLGEILAPEFTVCWEKFCFSWGHTWKLDVLLTNQREGKSHCKQAAFTQGVQKTLRAAAGAVGPGRCFLSGVRPSSLVCDACGTHMHTHMHTHAPMCTIPQHTRDTHLLLDTCLLQKVLL